MPLYLVLFIKSRMTTWLGHVARTGTVSLHSARTE